jgi:signal transduction histidine kinase
MTTETAPRINDHTLTLWGRTLGGAAIVVAILALGALAALGRWDFMVGVGAAHSAMLAVGLGALVWVTMTTQQRNREVWVLGVAAGFAALFSACLAGYAGWGQAAIESFDLDAARGLSPADLPTAAALVAGLSSWVWMPGFFLVLTLGLLLFPDGRTPTPGWRWVAWYSAIVVMTGAVGGAWFGRPSSTVPILSDAATPGGLEDVAFAVLVVLSVTAVALSVAGLVARYRASTGVTRHQIRWIAWGGGFFGFVYAVLLVGSVVLGDTGSVDVTAFVLLFAEALVIAAFWIAITRHRLYDVDVVISRTVTYGALAVFITAVYVAIVVGLGNLLGQRGEANVALAIGATAAVALLFEPVRRRVQRWANRLVYGRRATPYEVLVKFSARAATESDEEVLERIPRLIVDGTGATRATLWTMDGDELHAAAWWPQDQDAPPPLPVADGAWNDPEADYSVPVEHRGDLLGGISLAAGRGESLAPGEEELIHNLAGGLGLALRNARLTDDLRHQVAALAESRERILTAADEARRDLERDLDMGPQQELVAVKVKLGVVRSRAEGVDAARTAEVLGQLEQEVGKAIVTVRDFARGVYPPLLEADGLSAAVSAEADKAAIPVSVETRDVGRYTREIETAVFFTVLEALQNAAKYADPTSVTIRLVDDGRRLSFDVADDGRGFEAGSVSEGSGIPGMRDRIDAAGGRLAVVSTPGGGTTISGSVPIDGLQPRA